jgi:hypothetical protein
LSVEREDGPLARIVVPIPQGDGFILLRFEDTPLRAASKWVSIVTATLLFVIAFMLFVSSRLGVKRSDARPAKPGVPA